MLIEARNLIGLATGAIDDSKYLGKVSNILVDKNNSTIIGLIINTGSMLFSKQLFLAGIDILEIDKNGVTTRSEENLIDPNEVLKARNILKEKFSLFNLPVYNKSGKKLGHIADFVIKTEELQIIKFYINNLMENKIISYENVIKISKQKMIIDDDNTLADYLSINNICETN